MSISKMLAPALLLTTYLCVATSFLLDCYSPSQCSCDASILHCERRGLTSVPPADTNSEVYVALNLAGNDISSITKNSFQNYRFHELDLSHNAIVTFDPDAFLGLEDDLLEVNLEDTQLRSIPISLEKMVHLKKLNIKNNSRVRGLHPSLTAAIGKTLISLSIGGTGIRYWPSALSSLTNLQFLDMSHNKVSYLSTGATDAFAGTLRSLLLVNSSFSTFQEPLKQLRMLEILDLSNNSIQTIAKGSFSNMAHSLREFKLVSGQLSYLPEALEDLRALEELDLSNNSMMSTNGDVLGSGSSTLLTGSHSSLTSVGLANCSLVAVPRALEGLDNLVNLDLSHNKIATLQGNQFQTLKKLAYLNLNNNPIKNVAYRTFAGLASLTQLNLSGCMLSYIPSSALTDIPSLMSLDLSHNQISMLLDYAFPSSPSLATVDLSGNHFTNISADTFNGAHSIRTLTMNNCSLTSIPRSVSRANGLRAVYLKDNQIPCTCAALSWVRQWRLSVGIIPRLYGTCANDRTRTINDFVSEASLKQCPDAALVG